MCIYVYIIHIYLCIYIFIYIYIYICVCLCVCVCMCVHILRKHPIHIAFTLNGSIKPVSSSFSCFSKML